MRAYSLKVARGENGDGLKVEVVYAPAGPVPTRHRRRMRRWTRLVKRAAYAAAYAHVGRANTPETVDEFRRAVLDALRTTATRYAHLKK